MLNKVIVVCGPNLSRKESAMQVVKHQRDRGLHPLSILEFPEQEFGAKAVRDLVRNKVEELKRHKGTWTYYVATRYEHAVSELAMMVPTSLSTHQLEVWLVREPGDVMSQHGVNKEGYLNNDWPMGILW